MATDEFSKFADIMSAAFFFFEFLLFLFIYLFILFFNFTILYWFCYECSILTASSFRTCSSSAGIHEFEQAPGKPGMLQSMGLQRVRHD